MKLRWKAFERMLRQRVRRELRASKPQWRDYRQARKARRQETQLRPWFGRLFFLTIGIPLLLQARMTGALIPFMVLWTLGSICLRAGQLHASLYVSSNLNVFHYLPIGDRDIFRVQFQGFARLLWWSVADFTLLYSMLLLKNHSWLDTVAGGAGFGLMHGLFIGAAALCVEGYGPRRLYLPGVTLFMGGALALAIFGTRWPQTCEVLTGLAPWVPPLGWTLYALGVTPSLGPVSNLLPCLLPAVPLALAPLAYRWLRDRYVLDEAMFARARRVTLGPDSAGMPNWAERFALPASEAGPALRSTEFLSGLEWSRLGLVERTVGRLLNRRERLVADFLVAGNPLWGKGVRTYVILLLFGVLIWPVFAPQLGILMAMLFVVVFFFLFSMGGWRGLGTPQGGGVQSPLYAVYPLSFWDIARVIIKVNLARFVLSAPFVLGAIALVLATQSPERDLALWIAIKAPVLGIVLQPLLVIMAISQGTNGLQNPKIVLVALLLILGLFACGFAFLAVSTATLVVINGAGLAILSAGSLAVYGRLFNRARIDLVPLATGSKVPG